MELAERNDIDRVGLNEATRVVFDEILADNYFRDGIDAYRLAAALAIEAELDIEHHSVKRQNHMYLQSQVDPEQIFSNLIRTKYPQYKNHVYRSLERFADLGIMLLKERIDQTGQIME